MESLIGTFMKGVKRIGAKFLGKFIPHVASLTHHMLKFLNFGEWLLFFHSYCLF